MWDKWIQFWSMGGYAFYVWLSYGSVFSAVAALFFAQYQRKKAVLASLKAFKESGK